MKSIGKSFEWWVSRYEKKTGEQFSVPGGFQLAFDEQHGFFVFKVGEWQGREWVEIQGVCVDRVSWVYESVIDFVQANNLAGVVSQTNKNIKAYTKATGAKVFESDNGKHIVYWEVSDVPIRLTKV